MGCRDRGSNHNAYHFDEKTDRWGVLWSPGVKSVEALDKDRVIEKIGSGYPGESLADWDFEQLESGRWKATCRVPLPN